MSIAAALLPPGIMASPRCGEIRINKPKRASSSVVEQGTFNPRVVGSIPTWLTSRKGERRGECRGEARGHAPIV